MKNLFTITVISYLILIVGILLKNPYLFIVGEIFILICLALFFWRKRKLKTENEISCTNIPYQ
jgi:hypothetical protein